MQTHELMAWLGPAAAELTPEQIERLSTEADRIDARYPHPDYEEERQAALSAAVQYLLGETTPGDAGRALIRARRVEAEALAASQQIAAMAVHDKIMSETAAAEAVSIDRMTLRDYLGKPRKRR